MISHVQTPEVMSVFDEGSHVADLHAGEELKTHTTARREWKIVYHGNVLRVWQPSELDMRLELPPHTVLPRTSRRANKGKPAEKMRPEDEAAKPQWA